MQRVSLLFRPLFAASAVCLAAGVAQAELYRWVDRDGITNYSNHKPRDVAARNIAVVEDRLSVYTPDHRLKEAMATFREQRAQAWELAALQRAYETERRIYPPMLPTAFEPPVYGHLTGALEHGVIVFPRPARRLPRLVQPELPPGRTAGMIVEQHGLVPGTTGFVPPRAPAVPGEGHAGFTIPGTAGPLAPGIAPPPAAGFTTPGGVPPARGRGRGR
jgi:hypothetical protein